MTLKFASLCRKSGRHNLAFSTLQSLLDDPESTVIPYNEPRVAFALIKQLWASGKQMDAFEHLSQLSTRVSSDKRLLARAHLKLGRWQLALREKTLDESPDILASILNPLLSATQLDPTWHKTWHAWALVNFEVVFIAETTGERRDISSHLINAIRGFFMSIYLGPGTNFQDTLRLLTLWFRHGAMTEVEAAMKEGFEKVSIDTWLQVIPQIIARIHTPVKRVQQMIHDLLANVGKSHPQALVYPVTVATKSNSVTRMQASSQLMAELRRYDVNLVDQALLVSTELIRVAILWQEMWNEGVEEASRLYFGDHNVKGMLEVLRPLHEILDRGPETMREISFQQAYGRDLQEANEWCRRYLKSGKTSDLNQAWDLYYHVFRRNNKQLPQLTTLELQYCSPKLQLAENLDLCVPGTYKANNPVVKIHSFAQTLSVIPSKQRPRKLTIRGSDGRQYQFLLKGHEDLRQDERVMQLFGLVNTLLANSPHTGEQHLSIHRYPVVPLSPNSGLIGWIPHSDTLHQLIKEYRESVKVPLNMEHRLMLQMAPDYDNLTLLQKVEVFEHALENTDGEDLNKVLWLKSKNSEGRAHLTRSLARTANQLHPLACRHVNGRQHSWSGRSSPQ